MGWIFASMYTYNSQLPLGVNLLISCTCLFVDEDKLAAVEHELKQVSTEIQKLTKRKSELIAFRDRLKDRMNLEKSKQLADKNWDRTGKLYSREVVDLYHATHSSDIIHAVLFYCQFRLHLCHPIGSFA